MLLAAREVLRSKLRFSLLSGAVGLLVFLILFQQALLGGLITDFIGAVENQDSPILVFNDQARSNVEGSFLTPDQVVAISEVDGVAESAPIGQATYTVEAGDEITDAVLFGYTLDGLGAPTSLTDGRLPEGPDEAVASSADADAGFGIGDVVQILGADGAAGPEITVVGLGDSLRWSVAATLFVSYETYERAQRAVNPDAEVVFPSLVAVRPAEGVAAGDLTARIDVEVDGVEALTNDEAVDNNPGVQGVNQSFQIILALAFLVVTLVIGFFFLILTVQKTGALTLLRAIGAPTSYLIKNLAAPDPARARRRGDHRHRADRAGGLRLPAGWTHHLARTGHGGRDVAGIGRAVADRWDRIDPARHPCRSAQRHDDGGGDAMSRRVDERASDETGLARALPPPGPLLGGRGCVDPAGAAAVVPGRAARRSVPGLDRRHPGQRRRCRRLLR